MTDQSALDKELSALRQDFFSSLAEAFAEIEFALLQVEQGRNEAARKAYGRVHSLKGASGSLGLAELSHSLHMMEDHLERVVVDGDVSRIGSLLMVLDTLMAYARDGDVRVLKRVDDLLASVRATAEACAYRILAVQRSRALTTAMSGRLATKSVELLTVGSATEAVKVLLTKKIDILLTDASMEPIDGLEIIRFAKTICHLNQGLPCILLTSQMSLRAADIAPDFVIHKNSETVTRLSDVVSKILFGPRQTTPADPQPIAASGHDVAQTPATMLRHIACLDDDDLTRKLIKSGLKSLSNCRIDVFGTVDEALKGLRDQTPDLLLLDFMLGDTDGIEAWQQLRRDLSIQCPVIFLTGATGPDKKRDLMASGAIGIIEKPFNPRSLATQIKDLWTRTQASLKRAG